MPVTTEQAAEKTRQDRSSSTPLLAAVAAVLVLFGTLVLYPLYRPLYVPVPLSRYNLSFYYVRDDRPYAWTDPPPPGFSVEERMTSTFHSWKSYQLRIGNWVAEIGRDYGMGDLP